LKDEYCKLQHEMASWQWWSQTSYFLFSRTGYSAAFILLCQECSLQRVTSTMISR
jgi:hypothetical protein